MFAIWSHDICFKVSVVDESDQKHSQDCKTANEVSSPGPVIEEKREPYTDEEMDVQYPGWRESPAFDQV